MASPLGYVYSRADALKRRLYDMITNPADYASMLGGRIQEGATNRESMMNQAFGDPNNPLKVTNPQALAQLTDMIMNSEMGFAQLGMVKPQQAAQVLRKTKVLDESGNPKLMYHGTPESFQDFEVGRLGAVFASPNPKFASEFAGKEYTVDALGGSPNVRPVYIDAKNPFDYENPSHVDKLMTALGKNDPEFFAGTTVGRQVKRRLEQGSWEEIESKEVQDAIKKLGFDAFYVNEGDIKNIAVFDPMQIKSAISDPAFSGLLAP